MGAGPRMIGKIRGIRRGGGVEKEVREIDF